MSENIGTAGKVLVLQDPLAKYRGIGGLIVIGPAELDIACRSLDPDNPNPLGLPDGWVPRIEVDPRTDAWIRSCIWRDDPAWKTRVALVLTPPAIGGIPTSLIGQNSIWGVAHHGLAGGRVRQDVFWSDHFVFPNYDWANVPAVPDWRWMLVYEHLFWTTKLGWALQQQAAATRGMLILTADQDAFALNVILAATGIRFRLETWSRTSTEFDGSPLLIGSDPYGVCVKRRRSPEIARGDYAASVHGVPRDFES